MMLAGRIGQWPRLRAISRRARHTRRGYSSSIESPKAKLDSNSPSTVSSDTSTGTVDAAQKTRSRFSRLHDRLPRFLQRHTAALRSAPVSHITAFVVLHEITAVVPLMGFGWYFYRAEKLPWFAQGAWFDEGIRRFGRYFRKKGWLGAADGEELDNIENERARSQATNKSDGHNVLDNQPWWRRIYGRDTGPTRREKWWGRGENGVRLVTSAAAAYALTKALLPLRLILSVWMTPAFARSTVVPVTRGIKNLFTRKK